MTIYKNGVEKGHAASHTDGTDDIQSATAAQKGLATSTQITKLDGIEATARRNTSLINVGMASITNPADGATYYFGYPYGSLTATANISRMYVPFNGTIIGAKIMSRAVTAGTGEDVSAYIRLNNTTDTLIATVGEAASVRLFFNSSLNIAVSADDDDYFEIKVVCPTWATDPVTWMWWGWVLIRQENP